LRDQHSMDHPAVCTINSSVNSATSRRSRQSVDGWLKGTLQVHLRETSSLLDPLLCMWKTRNMSSSKNRLRVACLGTEFMVGATLPVLTLSRCFGVGLITLHRRNPSYHSSKSSCRAAPDRILPLWLNCLCQSGEFQA
jgi:hypothetical protein